MVDFKSKRSRCQLFLFFAARRCSIVPNLFLATTTLDGSRLLL